jgi:hypothetical protein
MGAVGSGPRGRGRGWLLPGTAAALIIGGCHAPAPVYIVKEAPSEVTVTGPPPRALHEEPPEPPEPDYIWLEGYYHWDDEADAYQWQDGRWAAPREGYIYVTASYTYVNDLWYYRPPYWMPRPRRRHRQGWPPPLRVRGGPGGGPPGPGHRHHPRPGPEGPVRVAAPPSHGGPPRVAAPPSPGGPPRVAAPPSPGPPRVTAPPSPEPPRVAAPPSGNPSRVAAPPGGDGPARAKAPPSAGHAEFQDHSQPRGAMAERERLRRLKRRPEYRGSKDGRLVFSNVDRPRSRRYPTDTTGAIVLTPGSRGVQPRSPARGDGGWQAAPRVAPQGHRPGGAREPGPGVSRRQPPEPIHRPRVQPLPPTPRVYHVRPQGPRPGVQRQPPRQQVHGAPRQTVYRRPPAPKVYRRPPAPRVYHVRPPQRRSQAHRAPPPRQRPRVQQRPMPRQQVHRAPPPPRQRPRVQQRQMPRQPRVQRGAVQSNTNRKRKRRSTPPPPRMKRQRTVVR